jgi:hypothetical protein
MEYYRINVEVPRDAMPDELDSIAELVRERHQCEPSDHRLEIDYLAKQGNSGRNNALIDVRADRLGRGWYVKPAKHFARPAVNRAIAHSHVVKNAGNEGGIIEYLPVLVEYPTGDITHGLVYLRKRYSILTAFFGTYFTSGVLSGFDHCYPIRRDTGAVPWEAVALCGLIIEQHDLMTFADAVQQLDAEAAEFGMHPQPTIPRSWETVCMEPRVAHDPHELMYL